MSKVRNSSSLNLRWMTWALPSLVLGCVVLVGITGLNRPTQEGSQEKTKQEKAEGHEHHSDEHNHEHSSEHQDGETAKKELSKEQAALFKRLENYLSNTKFIGKFTVDGMEDKDPAVEEYEIRKIEKAEEGDYWLLTVRIKYCLLYTSPSPRDLSTSRMPSSA